ncbi:MAG: MarR family winged helix-turn-helix transcriptional regulator [Pseudomonadota bacterium]
MKDRFNPSEFLPYLLNQAAERTSVDFQKVYKSRYGMLRTEWRVMFHLGHYGAMTAREVCDRSGLHKTKVSRAVRALEGRRFLGRETLKADRRNELLSLTKPGQAAYNDLLTVAERHHAMLVADLSKEACAALISTLQRLSMP